MRFVQSLPPLVEPEPDSGAIEGVPRVETVPEVRARTLPPLIYHQQAETPPVPAINRRVKRHAMENDRRKFSRRIRDEKVLMELRSSIDRRRRKQRREDVTTAIDDSA